MDGSQANLDVDFSRAEELGNRLLPQLDALREADPIYWSAKQGAWIVSGHTEVLEGFRGHLPLSSHRQDIIKAFMPDPADRDRYIPYLMQVFPQWVTNTDPPEQIRLRKLMMKAFSKKVAEDNREFAREIIKDVLDKAAAAPGGEVEFMEEIARQLPARTILRLMGLSEEHLPRLKDWSYYLNAGLGGAYPSLETFIATEKALVDMRDIFLVEIEKRRANPTEDFLSYLVHASEEDDTLTEDELVGICHLTLIAGHDSTANSMALGVAALVDDPEAREFMRTHPDQIVSSVLEMARVSGMSTSMARIVTEDFTWHGRELKAGQFVHLMIVSANRDPSVFPNPMKIDMQRPQDMNVTFAPGLHHCIGHFMAKMQLSEFFLEFLDRFDYEVLDPELMFGAGMAFRGPHHLNLRLRPRQAA